MNIKYLSIFKFTVGLFFAMFSLVVSAQTYDACSNISGIQSTVPACYTQIINNNIKNCNPLDICPNISGNQCTVPDGYKREYVTQGAYYRCVVDNITNNPDRCLNISGTQSTVPDGFQRDTNTGNCTFVQYSCPSVDTGKGYSVVVIISPNANGTAPNSFSPNLCSGFTATAINNISGTTLPCGNTHFAGSFQWNAIYTPIVDQCSNITGTQSSAPSGTTRQGNGTCTCNNGGTNPPTCNTGTCANGANNWPTCNTGTCSNNATNWPTCTFPTVNGSCGTAQKNYISTATSYGSDTFCSTGTASPTSPAFPAKGGSQAWQCLGTGTVLGTTASCTATRSADASCTGPDGSTINSGSSKTYYSSNSSTDCSSLAQTRTCTNGSLSGTATFANCSAPTVNGSCGTADKTNKIYANTATSYGSDTFCSTGTASPASPAFPVPGGSQPWQCLGSGTVPGNSVICSAQREDDPPVTSCSIPTPNPNNISVCSPNKICSTLGMCNNLTSTSGTTNVSMRMTPNITSSNVCSVYWELTSDQNTVLYCGIYNSNDTRINDQNTIDQGFQVNTGTYKIKCFSDQSMLNLVTSSDTKTCVKNPDVKEI